MSQLNYVFFDEFKALDNLCRDIYGEPFDKRLGVTSYLEEMDQNAYQGSKKVSGWTADYNRLKFVRNLRNELAHSRNFMTVDICSENDIDFVSSFKERILNQTDPLAMLRKQSLQERSPSEHNFRQLSDTYTAPKKKPVGCLGAAVVLLMVVASIFFFLLSVKGTYFFR